MRKVEQLKCECCGGIIDRRTMKCPYCDTQYERDGDDLIKSPLRIEQIPTGVQTYYAAVKIGLDMLSNPETAQRVIRDQLAKSLAKVVAENMEVEVERSHYDFSNIYKGRIRIVESKLDRKEKYEVDVDGLREAIKKSFTWGVRE